jgi:hypothetical protein
MFFPPEPAGLQLSAAGDNCSLLLRSPHATAPGEVRGADAREFGARIIVVSGGTPSSTSDLPVPRMSAAPAAERARSACSRVLGDP